MLLYRASLQTLGAIALLALALACNGGGGTSATAETVAVISGTVTYSRVPLAVDASGVPTGLADSTVAANLKSLPARGVVLRIYQKVEQTKPDGTKTLVWQLTGSGFTDSSGNYSMSVTKDRPTLVELQSSFAGGGNNLINLIAEPGGFSSTTLNYNRLRYGMRKAADGTASTSTNNVPASVLSANTTVNFTVGLDDPWYLVNPAISLGTSEASALPLAVLETTISGHTLGTGSRVLGIGDTIATFVANYTTATPGGALDLHYWRGNESQGSFIEYARDLVQFHDQLYDPSSGSYHFRGALRAGPSNDDAWDEGVIMPLLARNALYSGNFGRTFSTPLNPLYPAGIPLDDLSPDMARIEGLAEAMAANLLKSPYLADTKGTVLASPAKDIRSFTVQGPYSAPAVRALAWGVVLKANNITAPGLAADWANMNPLAAVRFFQSPTALTNGATDTTARDLEPLNIYSQLTRLKEAKLSSEPVDLAAIFTDTVLTALSAPAGLTWPRATTTAGALATPFVLNWGTDPNVTTTALSPVTLSMAQAVQAGATYPNLSQGEVFYAGFSLTVDKRYNLRATISPALGTDASLDVDLPMLGRTFNFTGSGQTFEAVVIPVYTTAPVYHPVRLRLKSALSKQAAPVAVTIAFVPAP
ncbi:MAG: hypothetical protein HGB30_00960 [Holophagaceae bacterium]|nr:hypothetical protein [Holophagaceae bacterium]